MSDTITDGGAPASPEITRGTMFEAPLDGWWSDYHLMQKIEEQPGDTEIALQSMIVRTPDKPISVNGQPYDIAIDENELANRVNEARSKALSPGHYDPRALIITLSSDILPASISDEKDRAQKDVHNWRDGGFHLEVPREVSSSSHETDQLVNRVEHMLNRNLELGFDQHRALKEGLALRKLWTRLSTVAAAGVGEGIGIVTSDGKALELIGKGSAGAVIGAAAVGLAVTLKAEFQKRIYNGNTAAAVANRVYRRAIKRREKHEPENEKRIISLIPAKEHQAD